MLRHAQNIKAAYSCRYKFSTDDTACFAGKIEVDVLKNIVMTSIQHLYDIVADHKKAVSIEANPAAIDNLKQLQSLQKEIDNLTCHKLDLYNHYRDGELIKGEYFIQRKSADEQIKSLTSQISLLEQKNWQSVNEAVANNPIYEAMKDMPYPAQFSNEFIKSLVDSVIVYDESRIEIKWKFSDSAIAELLPQ
ncbi:MAG: hypothetical protein FWD71_06545 [Oscillospiraceae bacterium]|nr:hypothetical protein [Oscillospiraceae bacterium]